MNRTSTFRFAVDIDAPSAESVSVAAVQGLLWILGGAERMPYGIARGPLVSTSNGHDDREVDVEA